MAEPKLSLRKDRTNDNGECMVMARYRAKGEKTPLRLSTEIYVDPAIFQDGVIIGGDIHTRRLKQKELDDFLIRITGIIDSFKKDGTLEPLGTQVKARYDELYNKKEEPKQEIPVPVAQVPAQLSVFEAFQKFIDDSESGERLDKNGKRIENGTIKNYRSTLKLLKSFEKETGYILTWETVNYQFYKAFCNYCFDVKLYYDNNTGKYIKDLKSFLNYSHGEEFIPSPLYNKKWIKYSEKDPDSFNFYPHEVLILDQLTPDQLKGCINGVEVRDILMLSIFTCLRISDLKKLNQHSFKKIGNEYYINLVQKKTVGKVNSLALPPIANKYVKRFMTGEIKLDSDQYYNRLLKGFARWLIRHIQKDHKKYEKMGYILNDSWFKFGHPEGLNPEENKDVVFFTRNRKRRGINVLEHNPLHEAFSSHMGRRTGITMYLILGESAIEVMKRSGHKTMNQLLTYENMASQFVGKKYDWSAFNNTK